MRRYLEPRRPGVLVTSDVILVLRHDGKSCSPDVAVIEGDVDTSGILGGIHLAEVGGRPLRERLTTRRQLHVT